MTDLSGRVALVTGATRGIGSATADALAEAGAHVIVAARDVDASAARAAKLTADHGVTADSIALDVTDFAGTGRAIAAAAKRHGRLDVLVANAGVLDDALLGMITPQSVDTLLSVNVAGTIACVQAAARAMTRRRSGSVIVLASIVGERGSVGQTAYAASKSAVATIARSAAKELGPRGVRVNAVAPGLIDTDMIAHLPTDLVARRVDDTALRRLGTPADVASVIRFLAGDESAFVTGQVLGVDGGLVL